MKSDKSYVLCIKKNKLLNKMYNNLIKLENRKITIFMNFGNSKTSDPHRLLLNLSDKINFKGSDKYGSL